MSNRRFGDCLRRVAPLSEHDVEEILSEQKLSGQRFGIVALALGKCTPQQLWDAWTRQLEELDAAADGDPSDRGPAIDLNECGVDATAAAMIDSDTARRLRSIAIRNCNDRIIIASVDVDVARKDDALREVLPSFSLHFVRADAPSVDWALATYHAGV